MITYIYIFRVRYSSTTKIGISKEPRKRFLEVARDFLRYEKQKLKPRFKMPLLFARPLEKFLHKKYQHRRKKVDNRISGHTEVFSLSMIQRWEAATICVFYFLFEVAIIAAVLILTYEYLSRPEYWA